MAHKTLPTVEALQAFEADIAEEFNAAKIRAPIHLSDGNERQILTVFSRINTANDWICCTWRGHYQALCQGVPANVLKDKIMAGKSMVMNLPEYRFVSSSIVGGIPSVAVGIAWANKLAGLDQHVWCWCGDMSAETGAWHEAYKYARGHDLPITFVVEDNGVSVTTDTKATWGITVPSYLWHAADAWVEQSHLIYYQYKNTKYPHAGAGKRVTF